jgi:hypothetical protein
VTYRYRNPRNYDTAADYWGAVYDTDIDRLEQEADDACTDGEEDE